MNEIFKVLKNYRNIKIIVGYATWSKYFNYKSDNYNQIYWDHIDENKFKFMDQKYNVIDKLYDLKDLEKYLKLKNFI